MESELIIRDARPADAFQIGKVHADSWDTAFKGKFSPNFLEQQAKQNRSHWINWFESTAEKERCNLLVAELNQEVVGFSLFDSTPENSNVAEIFAFFTHPYVWGRSVAACLMKHTCDRLEKSGHSKVCLWTVEDNSRARRFYVKCGFAESGDSKEKDLGEGGIKLIVEYERFL